MTVMIFTGSLNMMLFCSFSIGTLCSLRINVGYIYLMELMPKRFQTTVGTVWNVVEAFEIMIGPLYFWQISHYWLPLFMCGYVQ